MQSFTFKKYFYQPKRLHIILEILVNIQTTISIPDYQFCISTPAVLFYFCQKFIPATFSSATFLPGGINNDMGRLGRKGVIEIRT